MGIFDQAHMEILKMALKKVVFATVLVVVLALLAACSGAVSGHVGGRTFGFAWQFNKSTQMWAPAEALFARVPALAALMSSGSGYSAAELSQLYIELTNLSNTALTGSGGTGVVNVLSGGTVIAANTFAFYRSGNRLYISDPYAVEAWLANYDSVMDEMSVTLDGSSVLANGVPNTSSSYTAAAYQSGTLQSAVSGSWYNPPEGGDGPPHKQQ
jgi:hypothetical protein